MKFFDSHCHLDLLAAKVPLASVYELAQKSNVQAMLVPATTRVSWQAIDGLLSNSAKLYKSYGFHPYFLAQHKLAEVGDLLSDKLQQADKTCVAVGEIGLDYSPVVCSNQQVKQRQIHLFLQQLEVASQFNKPVIIHHRKSIDDICKYLKQQKFQYGGVVHAFAGSAQQAKNLIDLGFYLGIGGTITYSRANKTQQAIQTVGVDNLLLETDSPDMPIFGKQGQPNQPGFLPEIFTALHTLFANNSNYKSPELLAEKLWDNTHSCFAI